MRQPVAVKWVWCDVGADQTSMRSLYRPLRMCAAAAEAADGPAHNLGATNTAVTHCCRPTSNADQLSSLQVAAANPHIEGPHACPQTARNPRHERHGGGNVMRPLALPWVWWGAGLPPP